MGANLKILSIKLKLTKLLFSELTNPSPELNKSDFAYWKILNKDIDIRNIVITGRDDKKKNHLYNPNNKLPVEYILDDEASTVIDKYENFLNIVMPNNLQIFDNIKNLIKNNFSIHSVINF